MSAAADFIRSSAFRWGLVGLLVLGAAVLLIRSLGPTGERATVVELMSDVTIRDAETGDTWTMARGVMEQELFIRAHRDELDADVGFTNPNTGKRTGFPKDWDELIERIRLEVEESKPGGGR